VTDSTDRAGTRVLIAGVSTRAIADSAARAGFAFTTIDGNADRDQHPSVRAQSMPRDFELPFTAAAAATAAASIEADAVVYLSNLDNVPDAVATVAAGRALWGNAPDVLRRARDPVLVAHALDRHGLPAPALGGTTAGDWLIKPLRSGGGTGIRRVAGPTHTPPGFFAQEYIEGTPGSIVFVAAGDRALPLAVSRQLIGDARFGADGFRYCGSIFAPPAEAQFVKGDDVTRAARVLAQAATTELGLTGLNGIDFIARGALPYAVEINPRWTAAAELVERAYAVNVFAMHAEACAAGRLPRHGLHHEAPLATAVGKGIVFARGACRVDSTDAWVADPDIRDVPYHGQRFAAGAPVCTVFATGLDSARCYGALVARAQRIYDQLEPVAVAQGEPITHHQS
jgi:predicted ATP-grasp superfamily ATP-dependent carboligase